MNSPDANQNPFRPPQADSDFQGLAADTEFLVSDACVLCGDEAHLPSFCIETAETDALVERQATLKWVPNWLNNLRGLLIFLLLISLPFSEVALTGGELLPILLLAGLSLLCAIVWIAAIRMKRKLRITWYLSRRVIEKHNRRRRLSLLALLATGIVAAAMGQVGLVPLLLVVALLLGSQQRLRPVFSGTHMGLNVVTGLSSKFLGEVQTVIKGTNAE